LPRIEEDGGSWLRRPKLYKRVGEPHKKKNESRGFIKCGELDFLSDYQILRNESSPWN
jgi:hypothetical protein